MAKEKEKERPAPTIVVSSAWSFFGALFLMTLLSATAISTCRQLAQNPRYRVALSHVHSKTSGDDRMLDSIGDVDGLLERRDAWSMFDGDLTPALQQAYESSPWVKGVEVRRKFPGTVEVDVDLVEPFALAEWDVDEWVVVDADGEILPSVDGLDTEALTEGPIIRAFPETFGKNQRRRLKDEDFGWFASAVREGTTVIHDLLEHAYSDVFSKVRIKVIDVSNFGGRISATAPETVLLTDVTYFDPVLQRNRPLVIQWGRSSGHPRGSIELEASQKLEHLEAVLAKAPRFAGISEIDVRFDSAVYRGIPSQAPAGPTEPKESGEPRRRPR